MQLVICLNGVITKSKFMKEVDQDSPISIATCYGLDGVDIESWWGSNIFCTHPSQNPCSITPYKSLMPTQTQNIPITSLPTTTTAEELTASTQPAYQP